MPQIRHQQSELLPMEGYVRRYTTPTLDAIRQKRRIEQNPAPKTHSGASAAHNYPAVSIENRRKMIATPILNSTK